MHSRAFYLPQTGRSLRQAGKQSVVLTKHQITLPGWNLLLWQQRMRRIWFRIVSLEAVLCRGGDSTDSELRAIEKAFYLPRILRRYVVILVVVFNRKSIGQPARGGCHSFITRAESLARCSALLWIEHSRAVHHLKTLHKIMRQCSRIKFSFPR